MARRQPGQVHRPRDMEQLAPRLGRETEPPIGPRDPVTHFEFAPRIAALAGRNAAAADEARRAAGAGKDQEARLVRIERHAQELLRLLLAIGPIGSTSCRARVGTYV